jgi:hypothetical protein
MSKKVFVTVLYVFLGALSTHVVAAERLTGIYSNMTFNNESQDVSGIEIFVVFSREGFKVIFQDAEGSPSVPVIVPAVVKDSSISFDLPERNGYSGKFVGRISNGKLVGYFLSGAVGKEERPEITLKRGRSHWQ